MGIATENYLPSMAKVKKGTTTFTQTSQPFESLKRFTYLGKSLAIGDFNGDGEEELFMGAPGYSSKGNPD